MINTCSPNSDAMKIKYASSKQWEMYDQRVKFLSYAGDIDAFWCNEHKQIFRTKHSAGVHCSFKHGIYIDGKNSRVKKKPVVAQTVNNARPLTLLTNTISQQVQNEPMWVIKPGDSEYVISLKQLIKERQHEDEHARMIRIAKQTSSPIKMIDESLSWAIKSFSGIQELEQKGLVKSEIDKYRNRVSQALFDDLNRIEGIFGPGSIRIFA